MSSRPLDSLVNIGQLKAEPKVQSEFDEQLVAAMLRVTKDVAERLLKLKKTRET